MAEYLHRGARPNVIGSSPPDRRIHELDDALRSIEASLPSSLGITRDPLRANTSFQSLRREQTITRGVVIHAIPYLNWYKVQLSQGAGWIGCMALTQSTLVPVGPRSTGTYGPNDSVLVLKISGLNFGIILGVLPPNLTDPRFSCGDWLVQGAGTGFKREEAHTFPIKSMEASGGVVDWSANRPLDELAHSKGFSSASGALINITDWLVQVRMNEMCGLWLSYWDSWCRLAGAQLLIESAVSEERSGDAEGESYFFRGLATYPWEALGLFRTPTDAAIVQEFDDADVQYSGLKAKVDLPDGAEDTQPVYRYFEYGGYLGQGGMRGVLAPPNKTGTQKFSDAEHGEGLFRETIGLDGSFCLVSAKRVYIGKRCNIVVPKEVKLPEDAQGDDSAAGGYLASGFAGEGAPHQISDVRVLDTYRHLRTAAGVNDLAAYLVNWQGLHPFHYHTKDFSLPQESVSTVFPRVQERPNYSDLADNPFVSDPVGVSLRIDHRYGDVAYFAREAFLVFHDDGTVQLGGGCGEQITLGGGDISFEAPGKIKLLAGTDLVSLAGQVCLRSHRSMDLSSANGDLRLKAEENLHVLAGNSGRGGVLIESKGEGNIQAYDGVVGSDVRSSGVVIKAKNSTAALLAKDIYLRTGDELGSGDITIDAAKGKRNLYVYASEFNAFTTEAVQFYFGPVNEESTVTQVYSFGREAAVIDTTLLVGGRIIGYRDSGIILDGGIYATDSIATAGRMADSEGGFLGQVPSNFGEIVHRSTSEAADAVAELAPIGKEKHQRALVGAYYQEEQLGNDNTLSAIGFSFRDPVESPGAQYATTTLVWPETRWQMMARLGLATGGNRWTEPAVLCQGVLTHPWPGRVKWSSDDTVFLRSSRLTMFDAEEGRDADRPYVHPALAELEQTTMEAGVTVIR